jgi:hypothetical protein
MEVLWIRAVSLFEVVLYINNAFIINVANLWALTLMK